MPAKQKPRKHRTSQRPTPSGTAPSNSNQSSSSFTPINATRSGQFPGPIPFGHNLTAPFGSSLPAGPVPSTFSGTPSTPIYSRATFVPNAQASPIPPGPIISPIQLGHPIPSLANTADADTPPSSTSTAPWQTTRMSTVGECYAEFALTNEEGNDIMFNV